MNAFCRPLEAGFAVLSISGALLAGGAFADEYPSKPVRVVVSVAPGGALDATARLVAQHLGEELGQPVVVENKPGAGGLLGIRTVKSSASDGYTLLAASSGISILPAIRKSPGYDPLSDFIPVGGMVSMPFILVTATTTPYRSVRDVLDTARTSPGKVSYASAGIGSATHLPAAKMFKDAQAQALHVPYSGNGPAMKDVLTGRVELLFEQYGIAQPHVKAGKLRVLGATPARGMGSARDIAPIAKQGLPEYDYTAWNGIFAPSGTPERVVARLNAGLVKVLEKKDVVDRIRGSGDEPLPLSQADFARYFQDQVRAMAKLVSELEIPAE